MVDIQTVSIAIASASVVAGVIYYSLQVRHQNIQIQQQTKMRQTDLIIRLYSLTHSREFLEAWETIRDRELKNMEDYKKKYGSYVELNLIYGTYQQIGMLLQRNLIDADLVDDLVGRQNVLLVYDMFQSYHEDVKRERLGIESDSFDYLYNEMKKREQRGAKNG